jgi:hypothetical protein
MSYYLRASSQGSNRSPRATLAGERGLSMCTCAITETTIRHRIKQPLPSIIAHQLKLTMWCAPFRRQKFTTRRVRALKPGPLGTARDGLLQVPQKSPCKVPYQLMAVPFFSLELVTCTLHCSINRLPPPPVVPCTTLPALSDLPLVLLAASTHLQSSLMSSLGNCISWSEMKRDLSKPQTTVS